MRARSNLYILMSFDGLRMIFDTVVSRVCFAFSGVVVHGLIVVVMVSYSCAWFDLIGAGGEFYLYVYLLFKV